MGWIDWSWWMKEEEKPAEPLVLGAELECEYGSQRSFLMVETDEISINDLPKACVEDSIAHRNIHPFGQCLKNDECYFKMDLEERWVNAEPQTERVNGKEIITTSSTLICKAAGMAIRAVTSGQDGRFARFQQFLRNMERKYPGLRETLEDPYGSVYLEGNYEMALQFLEEQIKGREEGLEIVTLYDPKNLEGAYILAALERLMTDCEVRSFEGFMNDLRDTANQQGMQGKEGWDQNYLNEAMMELLRKDCKETAERIETNPVYRGMEKHKMFGSWLRECTEAFAYTTVMYSSALAEGNRSGRRMEGDKGRGAVKKGEEKGKESGSVKGSSEMGGERVDGKGGSKGGTGVKKPYATSRPSYGKGQVEQVWENAKDPITGKVYDPSGVEITWDPTKPRNGQWDMGHIPGEKYSEMHQLYMDDVITKDEFLEWYRNPDNYRPELPSTNRSHKYE